MIMIECCPPFQPRPSVHRWMTGWRFMWGYIAVTWVRFDLNGFLEAITKTAIHMADEDPTWRPAVEAREHFEQPQFAHTIANEIKFISDTKMNMIEHVLQTYRDCGVELQRMRVEVHPGPEWRLLVDGVVRERWRFEFDGKPF